MDLSRRTRLLLALSSGLGLACAFPNPLMHFPLLAWISPAGLICASIGARRRDAFLYGLDHGLVFFSLTLSWIYTVMRVHGGLGVASSAGVLGLMVLVLALFPAAFAAIIAQVSAKSVTRAYAAAPFVWVATEFARTHMPAIGFPWNLLGYAASDSLGLLQLVPWTGIYGLSFLVAGYNALLCCFHKAARPTRLLGLVWMGATLALLAAIFFGPPWIPVPQPRYTAHLVQLNLPQTTEYDAEWMQHHAADTDQIEALTISAGGTAPGLVIWPEAPAPFSLRDAKFAARAARIAGAAQSYFLVGIVEWKPAPGRWDGPYNSAALLDPAGRVVFSYDKIHLVAFGEYVPYASALGFAKQLTTEVSAFKPGSTYAVGELPDVPGPAEFRTPGPPHKFGAFICFEAIFPGLVRQFVANGAELLINISNDGWFGRSAGPEQHLIMARVRAVENRRWLLRATNNGFTVAVDPYGRIVARLDADKRSALAAPYDFRSDRTLYSRFGDWLAWLCVIASAGFLTLGLRRPRM